MYFFMYFFILLHVLIYVFIAFELLYLLSVASIWCWMLFLEFAVVVEWLFSPWSPVKDVVEKTACIVQSTCVNVHSISGKDFISPLPFQVRTLDACVCWVSPQYICYIRGSQFQSSRPPPLCIFSMSLFVNTPDSDNQLVRSALHAWTVFPIDILPTQGPLLPTQGPLLPTPWAGKSAEVYFISEHSFMDLRCTTSSRTDECDIIYLCKYIQF